MPRAVFSARWFALPLTLGNKSGDAKADHQLVMLFDGRRRVFAKDIRPIIHQCFGGVFRRGDRPHEWGIGRNRTIGIGEHFGMQSNEIQKPNPGFVQKLLIDFPQRLGHFPAGDTPSAPPTHHGFSRHKVKLRMVAKVTHAR